MSNKKNSDRLRYRISVSEDSSLYKRLAGMSERDAKDWLLTAAQVYHHLIVNNSNEIVTGSFSMASQKKELSIEKVEYHPSIKASTELESVSTSDTPVAVEPEPARVPVTRRQISLKGVVAAARKAYHPEK